MSDYDSDEEPRGSTTQHNDKEWLEKCQYIPMRLTEEERKILTLLESALNVSEYTDNVDTMSRRSKSQRILAGLRDMASIASGLYVCTDLKKGERLVAEGLKSRAAQSFLQSAFEIGRRFKVMNPAKMRTSYGKLMYMLQDSLSYGAQEDLGLNLWKPLVLVPTFLQEKGALDLLFDARLVAATAPVAATSPDGMARNRADVDAEVAKKRMALNELVATCGSGSGSKKARLTSEEVQRVVSSIDDALAQTANHVQPVERTLQLLNHHFKPDAVSEGPAGSLAIGGGGLTGTISSWFGTGYYGRGYGFRASAQSYGASPQLSHNHRTQFTFVYQTLTLWVEVMQRLSKLWCLADEDLLAGDGYELLNTGQGLQRLQRCPHVAREMAQVLNRVQSQVREPWVGLSVVHLGDRDVPNALMFIDKYTQIPHMLNALVALVDQLDDSTSVFNTNPAVKRYVAAQFGSNFGLQQVLLGDFFKHAFDGDGDDGGSCIDGRLTSTWNWCSRVVKKPYYHAFILAGFQGFDGNWKE